MKILKKMISYIQRKRTIKKVNKALNIKLTKWQIAFIFDGVPIPAQIRDSRCNGKTLAYILRLCLKTNNPENVNLFEFRREYGEVFVSRIAYGDDGYNSRRMEFFERWLQEIYIILSKVKGLKIRDIRIDKRRWIAGRLYVR